MFAVSPAVDCWSLDPSVDASPVPVLPSSLEVSARIVDNSPSLPALESLLTSLAASDAARSLDVSSGDRRSLEAASRLLVVGRAVDDDVTDESVTTGPGPDSFNDASPLLESENVAELDFSSPQPAVAITAPKNKSNGQRALEKLRDIPQVLHSRQRLGEPQTATCRCRLHEKENLRPLLEARANRAGCWCIALSRSGRGLIDCSDRRLSCETALSTRPWPTTRADALRALRPRRA